MSPPDENQPFSAVLPGHGSRIGTSRFTIGRALRGGAVAAGVQYAVYLATFPFIVRHVGVELYGTWAAIAALLTIGGLADAGVRIEIGRRVSSALGANDWDQLRNSLRTGVGILGAAATCLLAIGLLAEPAIRGFFFPVGVKGLETGEVDVVIRLTLVLVAFSLVIEGHLAVLRGVQRTDVENLTLAAGVLTGFGTTLGLAYAGFGLWALLLGSSTQLATRWALQLWALRRVLPGLGFGMVWPGIRVASGYLFLSSLVFFNQLAFVVDSQWDRVVLARFVGAASVTFFSLGTTLVLGAQQVALIPLLPILAAVSELRRRDLDAVESTFSLLAGLGAAALTVLLGTAFVAGPAFITLWLGPGFGLAGTAVRLFAAACAINLLGAAIALRGIASGFHSVAAVSSISNIAVNGVASFALAATIGFEGPLIGSLAGSTVGLLVLCFLLWRRTHERWVIPRLAGPAFGVAVAALTVTTGLDHPKTWLELCALVAVEALVLFTGALVVERVPLQALFARASTASSDRASSSLL
jgi:O-antigen/teichoic acid export membrane protein